MKKVFFLTLRYALLTIFGLSGAYFAVMTVVMIFRGSNHELIIFAIAESFLCGLVFVGIKNGTFKAIMDSASAPTKSN